MALDSVIAAIIYAGNASTSTPYPVPFDYVDAADVVVTVTARGTGTVTVTAGAVVFSSAQPALVIGSKIRIANVIYEIATRTSDLLFTFKTRPTISATTFHHVEAADELTGAEFSLAAEGVRTAVAVAATALVTIYRRTPVIQPAVLVQAGKLPALTLEAMHDRITMIAQELTSRMDGTGVGLPGSSSGALLEDTAVFADATARGLAKAKRIGQFGVQLLPAPRTIWTATGTNAGEWEEYLPVPAAATPAYKLVIAATADAGIPGSSQNAIITRLYEWSADGIICAGDNRYDPATFAQAWAAFELFILDEKVWPALGNHDEDDWTDHAAKFSYLPASPANRRYYKISLGDGLLDLFVLHSGRDSSWNAIEPDGNFWGSAQWDWFQAEVAASTAIWKIGVLHHPPVTVSQRELRADINLDWPEFASLDGIICGHTHFTEWLTCRGTPIVNVSGGVDLDDDVEDTLNLEGVDAIGSDLLWHNERRQLLAKLTVTPGRFLVAYHDLLTGELVYQRDLTDKTPHRHEWGHEVVGPDDLVPLGLVTVGIAPCSLTRGVWVLSVGITGSAALAGTVTVDGNVAGTWQMNAGDMWCEVTSLRNVRRGALVKVNVTTNAAYGAWYGLSCYYRGQLVG